MIAECDSIPIENKVIHVMILILFQALCSLITHFNTIFGDLTFPTLCRLAALDMDSKSLWPQ